MSKWSNISSYVVILANLPLGYYTVQGLISDGGSMGMGYLVVGLNLLAHVFLIPAILNLFINKVHAKKILLGLNILGLIVAIWIAKLLFL